MNMRLNYRAIKLLFGLSYKQISALLLKLQSLNIIKIDIINDDGYHVDVSILDSSILYSVLAKKYTKGLSELDIQDLLPKKQSLENVQTISEFFNDIKELKLKYPTNPDNRYFKHFNNGQKRQFFATFAARVEKNKITLDDLDKAFKPFTYNKQWSLANIFSTLAYPLHDKLLDFLWIQTEGKVANVAMEAKAAKELAKWITSGSTTLEELEDCWISIILPSKYNPSLVSLKKALQLFSKIKVEGLDGRYTAAVSAWVENSQRSLYNDLKSMVNSVEL